MKKPIEAMHSTLTLRHFVPPASDTAPACAGSAPAVREGE